MQELCLIQKKTLEPKVNPRSSCFDCVLFDTDVRFLPGLEVEDLDVKERQRIWRDGNTNEFFVS